MLLFLIEEIPSVMSVMHMSSVDLYLTKTQMNTLLILQETNVKVKYVYTQFSKMYVQFLGFQQDRWLNLKADFRSCKNLIEMQVRKAIRFIFNLHQQKILIKGNKHIA